MWTPSLAFQSSAAPVTNPERRLCGFATLFYDTLDAYSRAIRINPYISEVWFDLGNLYSKAATTKSRTPSMPMPTPVN